MAMNTLVEAIPYVEALFILAMTALVYFGYLSLLNEKKQRHQNSDKLKWILSGLVGLALLSIALLLFISFSQG